MIVLKTPIIKYRNATHKNIHKWCDTKEIVRQIKTNNDDVQDDDDANDNGWLINISDEDMRTTAIKESNIDKTSYRIFCYYNVTSQALQDFRYIRSAIKDIDTYGTTQLNTLAWQRASWKTSESIHARQILHVVSHSNDRRHQLCIPLYDQLSQIPMKAPFVPGHGTHDSVSESFKDNMVQITKKHIRCVQIKAIISAASSFFG